MLQHGEKKDKKMSLLPIQSRLSSQAVGLEEVEPCQVWDVVQGAHCPTCPSNDPWDQGEIRIETSPGFGGQVGPVHSARSGDLHFKHKTYILLLQINLVELSHIRDNPCRQEGRRRNCGRERGLALGESAGPSRSPRYLPCGPGCSGETASLLSAHLCWMEILMLLGVQSSRA